MAKVGRPLKFESVDSLKNKINRYFAEVERDEWTITGLAVWLDTSRETLMDYEKGEGNREEYSDTIKQAKETIEAEYERRGWQNKNNNQTFAIFAMKNMGWKDKQEVEQRSININKEAPLTEDEQEELDNALNDLNISKPGKRPKAVKQKKHKKSAS